MIVVPRLVTLSQRGHGPDMTGYNGQDRPPFTFTQSKSKCVYIYIHRGICIRIPPLTRKTQTGFSLLQLFVRHPEKYLKIVASKAVSERTR